MILEVWSLNINTDLSDPTIKATYTIYNRMSILLKSLISITRVTPAYKLSRRQSPDSYSIYYRIYSGEPQHNLGELSVFMAFFHDVARSTWRKIDANGFACLKRETAFAMLRCGNCFRFVCMHKIVIHVATHALDASPLTLFTNAPKWLRRAAVLIKIRGMSICTLFSHLEITSRLM